MLGRSEGNGYRVLFCRTLLLINSRLRKCLNYATPIENFYTKLIIIFLKNITFNITIYFYKGYYIK